MNQSHRAREPDLPQALDLRCVPRYDSETIESPATEEQARAIQIETMCTNQSQEGRVANQSARSKSKLIRTPRAPGDIHRRESQRWTGLAICENSKAGATRCKHQIETRRRGAKES
jgi:hypothetical protein